MEWLYLHTRKSRKSQDLDFVIAELIPYSKFLNLKYKFINENGKEKIYIPRNYKIDVSDLRISNEISLQKIIDTRVAILIDRKNPRINAIGLDGLITK